MVIPTPRGAGFGSASRLVRVIDGPAFRWVKGARAVGAAPSAAETKTWEGRSAAPAL